VTQADREVEERVQRLTLGEPRITHYIAAETHPLPAPAEPSEPDEPGEHAGGAGSESH